MLMHACRYRSLGAIQETAGQHAEAVAALRAAVRLAPTDLELHRALTSMKGIDEAEAEEVRVDRRP